MIVPRNVEKWEKIVVTKKLLWFYSQIYGVRQFSTKQTVACQYIRCLCLLPYSYLLYPALDGLSHLAIYGLLSDEFSSVSVGALDSRTMSCENPVMKMLWTTVTSYYMGFLNIIYILPDPCQRTEIIKDLYINLNELFSPLARGFASTPIGSSRTSTFQLRLISIKYAVLVCYNGAR